MLHTGRMWWVISQDKFTRFTIDRLTLTCCSTMSCQGQSSKFGWSKEIPCSSNVIDSWWFPSLRSNGQMSFPTMLLHLFSDHIQHCIDTMCFFSPIQWWQLRPPSNTWKRMEDPSPNRSLPPNGVMTTGRQSHDESEQQRRDMAGPSDV